MRTKRYLYLTGCLKHVILIGKNRVIWTCPEHGAVEVTRLDLSLSNRNLRFLPERAPAPPDVVA